MFKLALNAGHGLYTAGKRCLKSIDPNETREWTLNSRVCDKIESKLAAYTGYELLRLDDKTGKTDVALKTRTDKANAFKADFYLSIHHNAGIGGKSGGGLMAFTYTKVDAATKQWQSDLYNELIKCGALKGNRSNPLAQSDLHECRESNMPAVLLECGFMDSTTDTPVILTDAYADKVATACVNVIVAHAKLSKKDTTPAPQPTPTPTPAPTPQSTTVYYAKYTGSSGSISDALKAIGVDNSFTNRAAIAKANGITNYSGTAAQNTQLLNLLKQGKLIKTAGSTPAPTPTPAPTTKYYPKYTGSSGSISDALKSLGINNSFSNRGKIAKANGIKVYLGTAAQNTQLLNLLKQGKLVKV